MAHTHDEQALCYVSALFHAILMVRAHEENQDDALASIGNLAEIGRDFVNRILGGEADNTCDTQPN